MDKHLFFFFFACIFNLFYYLPSLSASPIIGGIMDQHHSYKYHVSIHTVNSQTHQYQYICGGSLIHGRYILTAAHNFIRTDQYGVIIRRFNFVRKRPKIIAGTNQKDGSGIERDIIKIFIPNIYRTPDKHADIAVAQTELEVRGSRNTIEIIPIGAVPLDNYEMNKQATFSGFGIYELITGRDGIRVPSSVTSNINRFLTVMMLGINDCPEYDFKICARSSDRTQLRTACLGDSGAGLIFGDKIIGVLSYGPILCNSDAVPITFTRISAFRSYVDRAMNEQADHSDMRVYTRELTPHSSPRTLAGDGKGSSRSASSSSKRFNVSKFFGRNKHSTSRP